MRISHGEEGCGWVECGGGGLSEKGDGGLKLSIGHYCDRSKFQIS